MKKKTLITTTNSVEGQEIEKYIEVISDRIVVGAGLFSEFFASFTDAFGGRSGKFEVRMHELYDALFSSLESQAKKLNADAIVGLKIDIDEISGKNSQMFMISGIGTAVKLKNNNTTQQKNEDDSVFISNKDVKLNILKTKAMKKLDEIEKSITGQDNKLVIIVSELNNNITQLIEESISVEYVNYEYFVKLTKIILSNFEDNDINDLYAFYGKANYPSEFSDVLVSSIIDLYNNETLTSRSKNNWSYIINKIIFNYVDLIKLAKNISYYNWSDYLFPILLREPEQYYKNDLPFIKELLNILENIQLKEPQIQKVKRSEVWVCTCGAKNSLDTELCNCSRNKYGLTQDFINKNESIISTYKSVLDCANNIS